LAGHQDNLDRQHMRRAIAAGRRALGHAWPNPAVGCVVVSGDGVIAEAFTARGGRPHAEEQALAAAGAAAGGATAYVTLEPCAERSTGAASCTDLLIAAGVVRVVAASRDASPHAAGRGLQRLRDAGLRVEIGLMEEEAEPLAAGFLNRLATGRPLVETADEAEGYDAAFEPAAGEALESALKRYGAEGYTRLWTPRGGALAWELARQGLLSGQATEAMR
jgi:diaminohydroxyphosphoribosylaminopyrimidine deaminase/5-amino-6-(5-phosphoribosylamino)uracil reductase